MWYLTVLQSDTTFPVSNPSTQLLPFKITTFSCKWNINVNEIILGIYVIGFKMPNCAFTKIIDQFYASSDQISSKLNIDFPYLLMNIVAAKISSADEPITGRYTVPGEKHLAA